MYNSSDIHSSDYISVSSTSASSSLSSHYYTQSETDISEIGRARFLDATSSDHAAVAAPTWHDGSCPARLPRKRNAQMQKEPARTIRHYYRTRRNPYRNADADFGGLVFGTMSRAKREQQKAQLMPVIIGKPVYLDCSPPNKRRATERGSSKTASNRRPDSEKKRPCVVYCSTPRSSNLLSEVTRPQELVPAVPPRVFRVTQPSSEQGTPNLQNTYLAPKKRQRRSSFDAAMQQNTVIRQSTTTDECYGSDDAAVDIYENCAASPANDGSTQFMDISDGIYENLKERAALASTASSSSSDNSSSSSRNADGQESLEDAAALYGRLTALALSDARDSSSARKLLPEAQLSIEVLLGISGLHVELRQVDNARFSRNCAIFCNQVTSQLRKINGTSPEQFNETAKKLHRILGELRERKERTPARKNALRKIVDKVRRFF
ncbi:hypothetical protein AAVH_30861 [Aphelenchoides avenae]|nr:hypothetical protein AAVH_30861 [Aphelenchus avenae]